MARPPLPRPEARRKPPKPRGGRQPYRKGAEAERRVQRALEASGWLVTRSPKSSSPYDLMCTRPCHGYTGLRVHLIQVKSQPYLRPAERDKLLALKGFGVPVLAWITRGVVHRRDLRDGRNLADLTM